MSEEKQQTFNAELQKEGSFTFVSLPFSPREAWGHNLATALLELSMSILYEALWGHWDKIIFCG